MPIVEVCDDVHELKNDDQKSFTSKKKSKNINWKFYVNCQLYVFPIMSFLSHAPFLKFNYMNRIITPINTHFD